MDARLARRALGALVVALALAVGLPPARAAAQSGGALDAPNSDIVLVIDNSGSMRQNDPQYLRLAAAKLFVDLTDPGDKIGVVVLSGARQTRLLTPRMMRANDRDDLRELKDAIDRIRREPMGEETHMGTALELAYAMLESTTQGNMRANQNQFVVMLTDGLPTGAGQTERLAGAIARFQARRYWKVFSIALGKEADPGFLQRAVAAPTGGEVVVASRADDLLDSYLNVYERAGDDRFVDRVTVAPNTLAPLADIAPDQQPTQVSVVLLRDSSGESIASLVGPDGADVVQPFYQNTVRRGDEPEYQLYKVPPEAQVPLEGRWAINIATGDAQPSQVYVLTRTRLRLQLPVPSPLRPEDDSSVRYHPLGRPLLLTAGAQVAVRDLDSASPGGYRYRWVTGMRPSVTLVGPQPGPSVALADDGRRYDTEAGDGRYTGLFPALTAEGDYTLRLEAPRHTDKPVHISKDYTVRVTALPTMTLILPPGATTLPLNQPFEGLVELPGRADFAIDGVSFVSAFVERPDGVLDPLEMARLPDGRFRFQYTPAFVGPYRIVAAAEVHGRGPMGNIRYVDYTEASAAVPATVPLLRVSAAFTQTLTYDGSGVLKVPLRLDNRSAQAEPLRVGVEGLPGGTARPAELLVAANEVGQRTIAVQLPAEGRPAQGQVTLVLTSPGQRVIVEGGRVTAPFRRGGGLLLPVLLLVAAAGGAAFFVWRRRRQRARALLAPMAPRRVS